MFNIFRRGSKKKTNNKFSKQQQQQQKNDEENQNAKDSKIEKNDGATTGSSRNETIGERSATDDHQKQNQSHNQLEHHQKEEQQKLFEYPATTIDYVSLPIESIKKEEFSEFGTNVQQHPQHASKSKNFRDFFNDLIMAKGRHRNRHQNNNNNNNNNNFGYHNTNNQKNKSTNQNQNHQRNDSKHGYQITDSKNSEKNLEEKKVASEESARALSQRESEKFENESKIHDSSNTKTVEQSNGNGCAATTECSEEENFDNLSELTECDRDTVMGQNNGKTATAPASLSPRSRSPREFRESKFTGETVDDERAKSPPVIPKITVEDFSKGGEVNSKDQFLPAEDNEDSSDDDEEDEEESGGDDDDEEDDDEDEAADRITPLVKSENSSDSNLSSPDSGYVGSAQNASINSHHPQFIRDGSSTDCDEHLIHDDFISGNNVGSDEILIESISLPDVVVDVEASQNSHNHLNSCDNYLISASGRSDEKNVHFVPIKVEKRGSVDDSVVNEKSNGFYTLNNNHRRNSSGVVITAEEDELEISHQKCLEEKKRELVNQEIKYTAQLDEAQKQIESHRSKITDLQNKISDLEKDLSAKTWNVERLQGELEAAHKEDEGVRKRLKILEDEKNKIRQKHFEDEESYSKKYDELDKQYKELEEKYKNLTILCCSLHSELAGAQVQEAECRKEADSLRIEKDQEMKTLQNALKVSEEEKQALETKWQKEFELLRTQNADREEHLITDCEWQLRIMQKQCKDKIDSAEKAKSEALEKATKIESEAKDKFTEVSHLKTYEAEVKQLRGLTCDQRSSIVEMTEKIEELKSDLEAANQELETQIEFVKKIKYQCDQTLSDNQRQMIQKIDEVRNDAAEQWETKLITEMTRLKIELESVYIEDRRDELDRLQAEHIEEIKALTNRYSANEEELRQELEELQQQYLEKQSDYQALRDKSDNAILQTRMHLDRADRDYQHAMCREEEKKEQLMETLREEFEKEKLEMEEKFRERLGHVKEEFSTELATQSQELKEEHKKELEDQYVKLMAEKEEAIQDLERKHRKKYEQFENKMRFEEMRMRYERRDPRNEDLKEISELRNRCESQERDLCVLTERLRDMQMQIEKSTPQENGKIRKPPAKIIPTTCDVIYEENEDRESVNGNEDDEDEEEDEDDESGESEEEEEEDKVTVEITSNGNGGKLIQTSC
ncbi:hypothetical protein ACFFRR_011380 [Megaselia abdita]